MPEALLSKLTHSLLNLTGANGTKLETLGSLTIKLGFSEEFPKLELQAIVARNLCETILIGSDFLTDHSCILNYSNLTFTVNDLTVPLLKAAKPKKTHSFKIKVAKTVNIPPKTIVKNILCSTLTKIVRNGALSQLQGSWTPQTNCFPRNLILITKHSLKC